MGELIKIVAGIVLIAFLLIFGIPMVWAVIKMIGLFFGGMLSALFGGVSLGGFILFAIFVGIIIVCAKS